eukprot:Rmarinus@m.26014
MSKAAAQAFGHASAAGLSSRLSLRRCVELGKAYLQLSKYRLSSFVVITSMAGYAIAPSDDDWSWGALAGVSVGTGLTAASANTLNQVIEVDRDKRMPRTRLRPLPCGVVTPRHAVGFAAATALAGGVLLQATTNSATTGLGLANIALYAAVYTPMKVMHHLNTWMGAVVGAIPPLMGWSARTGGSLDERALLPAALLYFWQIPHFMALSWKYRFDYARGGYQMLAVTNVGKATQAAVNNSAFLVPLGALAAMSGVTDWWFAGENAVLSGGYLACALAFRRNPTHVTSGWLFKASLVHLPLSLSLMCYHKAIPKPPTAEDINCFFKPGFRPPVQEQDQSPAFPRTSIPSPIVTESKD